LLCHWCVPFCVPCIVVRETEVLPLKELLHAVALHGAKKERARYPVKALIGVYRSSGSHTSFSRRKKNVLKIKVSVVVSAVVAGCKIR
jgi:hypothetical protein